MALRVHPISEMGVVREEGLATAPLGFLAGDANLYRYVGNNPTNATDPSGFAMEYPLQLDIPQKEAGRGLFKVTGTAKAEKIGQNDGVIWALPENAPGRIELSGTPEKPLQARMNRGVFIGYSGPNAKQITFVQFIRFEAWLKIKGKNEEEAYHNEKLSVAHDVQGVVLRLDEWQVDSGLGEVGGKRVRTDPRYVESGAMGVVGAPGTAWMFDAPNMGSLLGDEIAKLERQNNKTAEIRLQTSVVTYIILTRNAGNNEILGQVDYKFDATWKREDPFADGSKFQESSFYPTPTQADISRKIDWDLYRKLRPLSEILLKGKGILPSPPNP